MKKFIEKIKYLLPFIGAWLGSLGGQGVKEMRRVVLPIFLSICGILSLGWAGVTLGFVGIPLSLGYGRVDEYDDGSTLGRFWNKIFPKNLMVQDIMIRSTVGLLICLTTLSALLINWNIKFYLIGCGFIMLGQSIFSWQGFGVIKIKDKELLWSDLINYFLMGIGYIFILL